MKQMVGDVIETAKGISDFGMLTIAAAFFLVLSGLLMFGCFKWFRTIIDNVIKENSTCSVDIKNRLDDIADSVGSVAEGLRPETLLRIKAMAAIHFKYAIERVCRIIKRVREENNIINKEATSRKIRALLKNLHDERNQAFDCYTFKGRKLSEYTCNDWIEKVAVIVEGEIYHEAGPNNKRAYTNVLMAYDEIENNFLHRLNED